MPKDEWRTTYKGHHGTCPNCHEYVFWATENKEPEPTDTDKKQCSECQSLLPTPYYKCRECGHLQTTDTDSRTKMADSDRLKEELVEKFNEYMGKEEKP